MVESALQNRGATGVIGKRLRSIRTQHKLTGEDVAKLLGSTQGRISKIEGGKLKPSADFVRKFADKLKLSAKERLELELLTHGVFLLTFNRCQLTKPDAAPEIQEKIAEIENEAKHFRCVDWFTISGLLQTERYASHMFKLFPEISATDAANAVRERMSRQQILRPDEEREFEFLIAEHAFYVNFCPREVILEQIDHVKDVARQKNVVVRILPLYTPVRVIPTTNFDVFDDSVVLVETRNREFNLWERDEVKSYVDDFALLERCSTQSFEETAASLAEIKNRVIEHWR